MRFLQKWRKTPKKHKKWPKVEVKPQNSVIFCGSLLILIQKIPLNKRGVIFAHFGVKGGQNRLFLEQGGSKALFSKNSNSHKSRKFAFYSLPADTPLLLPLTALFALGGDSFSLASNLATRRLCGGNTAKINTTHYCLSDLDLCAVPW